MRVRKCTGYDGPNCSLFISILLHNSERILNSEFGIRSSEYGIVKKYGNEK